MKLVFFEENSVFNELKRFWQKAAKGEGNKLINFKRELTAKEKDDSFSIKMLYLESLPSTKKLNKISRKTKRRS